MSSQGAHSSTFHKSCLVHNQGQPSIAIILPGAAPHASRSRASGPRLLGRLVPGAADAGHAAAGAAVVPRGQLGHAQRGPAGVAVARLQVADDLAQRALALKAVHERLHRVAYAARAVDLRAPG